MAATLAACAQQLQVKKYSPGIFVYQKFKDARITFGFMRHGKAKANIFLKNSQLVYMKDSTIMQADLSNVVRVDFDSASYMKANDRMGRIVAEANGNYLLDITEIDLDNTPKNQRGEQLPFFEMPDFNVFLEVEADYWDEKKGYPLKDTYVFLVQGRPVPAQEKEVRRAIKAESRAKFKDFMKNRFWSWNDAESLRQLLPLFP